MKQQADLKAHATEPQKLFDQLESGPTGLKNSQASERLARWGHNKLPQAAAKHPILRFLAHFHDILIYILILAGVLTAWLGHWVDTFVILAVVIINGIIGFVQEGKAEQALKSISKMLSLKGHVLRDTDWQEIDAADIVPGDIVRLRSGDRVPADLRLFEVSNLRIDESALTGESIPVDKDPKTVDAHAALGDRNCMAYSGTLVAAGRAQGIVTATGRHTEIGRINTMISEVQRIETPLTRQMNSFGKKLSIIIIGLSALMAIGGRLLHAGSLSDTLLSAIGFAVAAIPEGLPAIMTITLALGVQRMAGRNAITRKLNAVETLGSVTVICSDKTGTLTQNEMTAVQLSFADAEYQVSGNGYQPTGQISIDTNAAPESPDPDQNQALQGLIQIMTLCNDTELQEKSGRWGIVGEPTEGALKALARKAAFDEQGYERLAVLPFESDNKYMATLHKLPQSAGPRILLKGAPDRLLARCSTQIDSNNTKSQLDTAFWEKKIDELGARGLRVLAAAYRDTERETLEHDDLKDMSFCGLVGIVDPPRPEAIEAIATCHRAGIRVIMITGDHAGTAAAIGREMGIDDSGVSISGPQLETASDAELQEMVKDCSIFARTSPEHKLRLVKALQADGEVVAMTGDGVNDAPALKRADVGVAMGIKGTEATKEAAQIVLADDNFTSIEHAVEEGRTIYDNLRKAILFILPTNGGEALVILTAVLLGLALPLTPVQILWVNMVTAVTLAVALAFEPSEPDIMDRPPRRPDSSILDRLFLWRIFFVSTLIAGATMVVFLIWKTRDIDYARTLAVNTLVIAQVFYLFNSRYLHRCSISLKLLLSNKAVWISVAVLGLLQTLFVYAPFMHRLFGSVSVDSSDWLPSIAAGAAIFLLVELEKRILYIITRSSKKN